MLVSKKEVNNAAIYRSKTKIPIKKTRLCLLPQLPVTNLLTFQHSLFCSCTTPRSMSASLLRNSRTRGCRIDKTLRVGDTHCGADNTNKYWAEDIVLIEWNPALPDRAHTDRHTKIRHRLERLDTVYSWLFWPRMWTASLRLRLVNATL